MGGGDLVTRAKFGDVPIGWNYFTRKSVFFLIHLMKICSRLVIGIIPLFLATNLFASPEVSLLVRPQKPGISAQLSLSKELVKALNSKDVSKLRQFIQLHLIPNAPTEQRVSRWKALGDQGAPFTLVKKLSETEDKATVVVTDRYKNRIALNVYFEAHPTVMIKGIQLSSAYRIEGLAPDLRSWINLNDLGHRIRLKSKSPSFGIAMIDAGKLSVSVSGLRASNGKEESQINDVWSVGAIGKPICSTLIAKLIEMGKLHWDEPLAEALPNFKMDPDYRSVTIEQIMQHRAGFATDSDLTTSEVSAIVGTKLHPSEIRRNYAITMLSKKPAIPPNSGFLYSNVGYAVLAAVAEEAGGRPYEELLRDLIFRPIGMTHSGFSRDLPLKGRTRGHRDGPSGLEAVDPSSPLDPLLAGAGSGLWMSVGDIARFGQMHLNGLAGMDGILKSTTVKRLHKSISEGPKTSRSYASGWSVDSLPGVETFQGHNGSNGTMRAQLAIFPAANLVVAATSNRGGDGEPSPCLEAVQAIGERYAPIRK